MLTRYFLRGKGDHSGQVRIKKEVSQLVKFRRINLMDNPWPVQVVDFGVGQLTTTSRSPPSTCAVCRHRDAVDRAGLGRGDGGLHLHRLDRGDGLSGLDLVARGDVTVTTPANGAAMWSGLVRSAFSAAGTSLAMLRSRTSTGRSWPLRMHITVRMPRSSGSETASSPISSSTPRSSSTRCSSPWRSP